MPGGSDSFDLLRTKDRQSNSKADTFFINPKGVGSAANQVQQFHTEAINGNVTGGTRVEDLVGNNLSISGGSLQAATGAPTGASYVTTQSESGLSNETVASTLQAVYGNPVPVGAADLRLDTGQSIEDGSGTERVLIGSGGTVVSDDAGDDVLTAFSGFATDLQARSNRRVGIFDQESGSIAVQYDTNPTTGTLSLPNAVLDAPNGIESSSGPVEVLSGNNLRLATGQSIEDGSGTSRLFIGASSVNIAGPGGNSLAFFNDSSVIALRPRANAPLEIRDQEGTFIALTYITSASPPGTLKLPNAVLDFQAGQASTTNDSMTANPESQTEDGFIEVEINGSRFQIPAYNS